MPHGHRWYTGTACMVAATVLGGLLALETAPARAASSANELSTQAVVTLLARRHPWIWQEAPDRIRVEERRTDQGDQRLVWVSVAAADAGAGGGPQHAFALLAHGQDLGQGDRFIDLTARIDTRYAQFVAAALDLTPGGPGAFALAAAAEPAGGLRQAALYVVRAPEEGGASAPMAADGPVLLDLRADLFTLERDPMGRLQVEAGVYTYPETTGILRVPAAMVGAARAESQVSPEAVPSAGMPARSITSIIYRWQPASGKLEAVGRGSELTPFGIAEAFLAALARADYAAAQDLTSDEWRRVMGVRSAADLARYVQESRPGLLRQPGRWYRYIGGTSGGETASVLFADPEGRTYRVRLIRVAPGPGEAAGREPPSVLPAAAPGQGDGVWRIDGLDGGG